ncbi:SCO family protein [Leadbetterella sp. DM7]|uniref:SCO family protein n=1 Tax=Leadbetterella sp. DM7 TaxID=3235085 RepID=UPI00349E665A
MNKTLKAGILFAILGIPVLTFIFLKLFGKNNFDLPYFFPETGDNGEVKMMAGDTVFATMPPFTLVNTEGDSTTVQPGKITVVNFFFSRCGTICPITNTNLTEVAESFKDNPDVHFYGISVDPKYDTPAVLKSYARALGMDRLHYDLLTGDKKYIYDLSIEKFRLPVADASEYDPAVTRVDDMFIHSDKIMLIDPEGHFRGIYSGTQRSETERLKLEIKVLLSHDKYER